MAEHKFRRIRIWLHFFGQQIANVIYNSDLAPALLLRCTQSIIAKEELELELRLTKNQSDRPTKTRQKSSKENKARSKR